MRRRPWLASLGLAAAILLTGAPSYADPGTGTTSTTSDGTGTGAPPAAPDTGSRPQAGTGTGTTGTGTGTTAGSYLGNSPAGPMGTQILLQQQTVQTLAEQAKQAQQSITTGQTLVTTARQNVTLAQAAVDLLQGKVDDQARKVYKSQAKVPDRFNPYASQLNRLNELQPWLENGTGYNQGMQDSKDYTDALKLLNQAQEALASAQEGVSSAQTLYLTLSTQYQQAVSTLTTLRTQNSSAVAELAAAENTYNAQFAGQIGSAVNGMTAGPKAQQAVRYALGQLGKPYQWGAEGPYAFDCSGLVLASYNSAGVSLPRVADDQYIATSGQSVPISALLPGDLLFYGTNPGVPTSIYHVAMYVGGGNMVQAPDYGIPVQVVPVGFGQLYGATRVVPAVKGKQAPPTKKPSPIPTPTTKSPSPSPSSPSPSPSSPSPSSPSPSASTSSSASASATDSAPASEPASEPASTTASSSTSASSSSASSSASSSKSSSSSSSGTPGATS
jgi:cell wall-associated NlpC family hydrolase